MIHIPSTTLIAPHHEHYPGRWRYLCYAQSLPLFFTPGELKRDTVLAGRCPCLVRTMSASSTDTQPIFPPPGTNFLASIDAALPFLLIASTMSSVLLVMLVALLFFSTPSMRRKPIFILNVAAILLSIAGGVINVYEQVHTLRSPTVPLKDSIVIVMSSLAGIVPTLADAILILRLYAVSPLRQTSRARFLFIIGVPILVTIGRLINGSIFIVNYAQHMLQLANTSTGAGTAMVVVTSRLPCVTIEWSLQVFIDIFTSCVFLSHVHSWASWRSDHSVSDKIKSLFWISVSNFVFPVIFNVLQLAIFLSRPDMYIVAIYIESVNFHFNIIGVVFATVWMAEGRWADDHGLRDSPTEVTFPWHAASREDGCTRRRRKRSIVFVNPTDTFLTESVTLPSGNLSMVAQSHTQCDDISSRDRSVNEEKTVP